MATCGLSATVREARIIAFLTGIQVYARWANASIKLPTGDPNA